MTIIDPLLIFGNYMYQNHEGLEKILDIDTTDTAKAYFLSAESSLPRQ